MRNLAHQYPPTKPPRRKPKHARPTDRAALRGVDLQVRPGEVFGLLGPNGSGKTTLFRILSTLLTPRPPAGEAPAEATVFGTDIASSPDAVRRQIGVVFQHPALDDRLTAEENLRYHGMLHGLTGKALHQRGRQMLQAVGLESHADEHVATLSGGMRRRIEIAKALLTQPRLLLMDEASTGLDPAAQRSLWRSLREQVQATGLTVLLTTHLMHEAERCDRLAVMSEGKIVAVDSPDGLIDRISGQVLDIQWSGHDPAANREAAREVLAALGVAAQSSGVIETGDTLRIELADAAQAVPIVAAAARDRAHSIRVAQPSLEDAYLALTGRPLHEDAP